MKKAKVMLMSICVLAVVGGALAFQAKSFNGKRYCTNTQTYDVCSVTDDAIQPKTGSGAILTTAYYTTTLVDVPCASNLGCSSTESITFTNE